MIGKKLGLGNPVSGGYDSDRTVFSVDVSGVRPVARAVLVDGVYDMSGWMGGLVVRVSVGGKFPSQRLSVLAEHLMLLSLVILLAKSFFDGWCLDRKRFTICCFSSTVAFRAAVVGGGLASVVVAGGVWLSEAVGGNFFSQRRSVLAQHLSLYRSFTILANFVCVVWCWEWKRFTIRCFSVTVAFRRAGVGVFIVNVNGYFVGEICVSLKFVVFIGNYSLTF